MSEQALVTSAVNSWKTSIERADKIFSPLNDEQLQKEVAPGKNRLIYLLGHLTAVHDRMLPLLGLGERLHPELDALFITSPDKTVAELPAAGELKKSWNAVNGKVIPFARSQERTHKDFVSAHRSETNETGDQ